MMLLKQQHGRWLVVLLVISGLGAGLGAASTDSNLIEAVKHQNSAAVPVLLKQGADVNARQPDGSTALHWAAYLDDLAAANVLIRAGADVNVKNELGATALWLASRQGGASMVGALLAAGANPNVALPEGETPLMAAARGGDTQTVAALLKHGADVNATDPYHAQTALMWAVSQRHPEAVKLLIEHGADVRARSTARNRMMKLHGNDQYIREGFFEERQGGYTPLLFAARVGDVDSARLLIAAGVNVNDTAPSGTSAVVVATHSGHPDVLAFLLDNGADPNASGAGYTALHAAVLRGDEESVKVLLAHKADPSARLLKPTPVRRRSIDFALSEKWLGATPFWLAAKFSEITIMRLLVSSGADPLLTSNDGSTPLMAAALGADDRLGDAPPNGQHRPRADPAKEDRDTLAAVALALKFGNDINAANQAGNTALHLAARRRLVAVVQQMAENGANVNAKTKRGDTPLSVLAKPLASEDGEALESPATERRSTQKAVSILQQFGAK